MLEIFLIVGLGNPGTEYEKTRHNVGFMFVDYLANRLGFPEFKEKFDALYSDCVINNLKLIIVKPQTYMNSSGKSVQQFVSFYKISTKNVFVIHDDLDIKVQDVRIKFSGSSGGHNGIKNIDSMIGSEYWRIRIGIGRPENKEINISDYVLSKFDKETLTKLGNVFAAVADHFDELLTTESPKTKPISDIRTKLTSLNDR